MKFCHEIGIPFQNNRKNLDLSFYEALDFGSVLQTNKNNVITKEIQLCRERSRTAWVFAPSTRLQENKKCLIVIFVLLHKSILSFKNKLEKMQATEMLAMIPWNSTFYFIPSSEFNAYLKQIKSYCLQ